MTLQLLRISVQQGDPKFIWLWNWTY